MTAPHYPCQICNNVAQQRVWMASACQTPMFCLADGHCVWRGPRSAPSHWYPEHVCVCGKRFPLMGQCVARIQIEHSKTTADFPLLPLLSSSKSLFVFCWAGGWGRGKIGPFLPLSYYFWRHTTLFSCDMRPLSNPLFGSLRMQHPWNLDILFSETWRQRGSSLSGGSGRGQGLLERSYSPGGRRWEF